MTTADRGDNSISKDLTQDFKAVEHRVCIQKEITSLTEMPKEKIYDLNHPRDCDEQIADEKWLSAHPSVLREAKNAQSWPREE